MKRPALPLVAAAAIALPRVATADQATKLQCIAANEEGQDLAGAGRLREARQRFAACSASECPGVLRNDCVARVEAVTNALPSARLLVRARDGRPLDSVVVTVDGRLAGRTSSGGLSVELDPGEHSIEVQSESYARTSRTVAVVEHVKDREIVFDLEPNAVPSETASQHDASRSLHPQRAVAYALGAAGIVVVGVGAYFGLAAKASYDDASSAANCPRGPTSCNEDGVSGARRANELADVSSVTFALGGALLISGVILLLTAPADPPRALAARKRPRAVGLGLTW